MIPTVSTRMSLCSCFAIFLQRLPLIRIHENRRNDTTNGLFMCSAMDRFNGEELMGDHHLDYFTALIQGEAGILTMDVLGLQEVFA